MKGIISIAPIALFVALFAAQETFTIDRKYKVDEKDSYKVVAKLEMEQGQGDASMTVIQKILKVHDNGDADVEVSAADEKLMMGGEEHIEGFEDIILRVDKRGILMPLSSDEHGPLSGISLLMAASGFTDKVMKVGEEIKVDVEAKDGKPTVKGTIKLESLKDGVAKIVSQCEVTSEEFDNATFKMTATSLVDTATSKPNKIDLKCDFGASAFEIKTITLSMERVK